MFYDESQAVYKVCRKSGLYFVTVEVFTQGWVHGYNGTGFTPSQQNNCNVTVKNVKNILPIP